MYLPHSCMRWFLWSEFTEKETGTENACNASKVTTLGEVAVDGDINIKYLLLGNLS